MKSLRKAMNFKIICNYETGLVELEANEATTTTTTTTIESSSKIVNLDFEFIPFMHK